MANYKSLWTAPALSLLLISGVTAEAALAAPTQVYAAKKSLASVERVNVRMNEEKRLASLDRSYAKQMRAKAKQLKKAAQAVRKQGGDSTALLAAADYYDNQAKNQETKEKKVKEKNVK